MRFTPENLTTLAANEVYVYGSNLGGIPQGYSGKRAAMLGATIGHIDGLLGQTYGIPVKDTHLRLLPLWMIKDYVRDFLDYSKKVFNDGESAVFLVNKIGCDLGEYDIKDMAPLFFPKGWNKGPTDNVILPEEFHRLRHLEMNKPDPQLTLC